jgi:hypothetical protein
MKISPSKLLMPLAFSGISFMVLWGRKSLPSQFPGQQYEGSDESEDSLNTYQLSERLVRADVSKDGCLDGDTLAKSGLREKYHFNVIAIQCKCAMLPIEAKRC